MTQSDIHKEPKKKQPYEPVSKQIINDKIRSILEVEKDKGKKLHNARQLFANKKEKPLQINIEKEDDQNQNFEERYGEIFKKIDAVAKKNNRKKWAGKYVKPNI